MITVNKETLSNALLMMGGIVKKNPHIPILENLHVTVKDGLFRLRGSDSESQMQYKFSIDGDDELDFLIPSHLFTQTILRAPSSNIDINLKVRENDSMYVNIKSGKGKFKIEAMPADNFIFNEVEIPLKSVKVTGDKLFPAFKRAFVVCDSKDMRPAIQGCSVFSYEGIINIAGNHQSIMSKQIIDCSDDIDPFLLSNKFCAFLSTLKYEGRVELFKNNNWFGIKFENYVITTKLTDDKPLEQKRFFEEQKPEHITLNRIDFEGVIKRVSGFTGDLRDNSIMFDIREDEMVVSANNNDLGHSASESIIISSQGVEPLIMSVNYVNLLNAVQNLESELISLYIEAENKPYYVQGVGVEKDYQNWLLTTIVRI